MNNLSELVRGGTICLSKAGLAEGTNDHTVKIAAPNGAGVDFAINGYLYHKADTDNIVPTTCAIQAVSTTCLYLVTLNSSGTLAVVKGTSVLTVNVGANPVVWPEPAASTCPIGALKIAAGTTTFQVGVDDLTDDIGTGSVTYYDLVAVPDAPIVS